MKKIKKVPGYPNYYCTSEGEVFYIEGNERVYVTPEIRSGNDWYQFVTLWRNKERKLVSLSKLVALLFIPNPMKKRYVLHKNGNKADNRASELAWGNMSEVVNNAYDNGRTPVAGNTDNIGPNVFSRKIIQFDLYLNEIREWEYATDASKKTGVHLTNLISCCTGKRKTAGGFIWKYKNECRDS